MPGQAAVAVFRTVSQRTGGSENAEETVLHTDDIVEQRCLVVGFADSTGDRCGFEVGVDGGVDFDEVVVGLEGLHEGAEAKVSLCLRHVDRC